MRAVGWSWQGFGASLRRARPAFRSPLPATASTPAAAAMATSAAGALPGRVPARFQRLAARYRRLLPVALGMTLVLIVGVRCAQFASDGAYGFDAFSYWRPGHYGPSLYDGVATTGGLGMFRYAPPFATVVAPLSVLDWQAFLWTWTVLILGVTLWLSGPRRFWLGLAIVLVFPEVYFGNIHVLLAAAIVVGFRHPAAWSFVLLTKVTPAVGLLWFVVRREWRALGVAAGATALVVGVSMLAGGIEPWRAWLASLGATQSTPADNTFLGFVPLPVRLAGAAALVAWGGSTDRRWTVLVAAVLALPTIWGHGPAMLVGLLALDRAGGPWPLPRGEAGGAAGPRVARGYGSPAATC